MSIIDQIKTDMAIICSDNFRIVALIKYNKRLMGQAYVDSMFEHIFKLRKIIQVKEFV